MGRALVVALLLVCSGNFSLAAAQVPVPEAVKVAAEKYEAEAARVSREHTALIAELKQKHAAQLDQLIAKAKDAGDLDGVLKLGEEKKKVARSQGPVGGTAPTAAASARRTYDEALKKGESDFKKTARAKLDDFLKELTEIEKAETKADRIASAKEVRAYRLDREKSGTSKLVIRENPLADAPTGEWVDLLEWSEGVDWAPRGIDWNANVEGKPTKAGIKLKGTSGVALPLPAIVDGDFEMDVEFTRNSGDDMSIVFPVGLRTMALVLAANRFDFVGDIDGHWADGNPTMKSPGRTINGRRHRVKITVHCDRDQASFNIDLDDAKDYIKWSGKAASLSTHAAVSTVQHPWCAAWQTDVTYHKFQIRMLSGTIRRDVITDADREQDRKNGFIRLVGEKANATKVGSGRFLVNQVPPEFGPGVTERNWPLITRDFQVCDDFYGAHAPSRLKCSIPTGAKSFSVVGHNEGSREAKYIVFIDGKQIYDSGVTGIVVIKVDIPAKATRLELVADPAGKDNFDHTYWCYPRFHSVAQDKLTDKMLDGKSGPLKFNIDSINVGVGVPTHNKPLGDFMKSVPIHFRDVQPCDEFLYASAPSTVTYQVPDGMSRFTAIGYNIRSHHVKYEVWADAKRIYESPQAGIVPIDVKLPPGTKTTELKINDLGNRDEDHSMWCYPRLHRK